MLVLPSRSGLVAAVVACFALLIGVLGAAPARAVAPAQSPSLLSPALDESLSDNPVFQWGAVPGAAKYRLQYATNESFSGAVAVDTVNLYATLGTDIANGNYWWRVAGSDGTTLGPWSDAGTFVKSPSGAPVVVGPDDGHDFPYPDKTPILSWQPLAGIATYKVEVANEPTFAAPTVLTTTNTSVTVTDSPLVDFGTTWFWKVYGLTKDGRATDKSAARSFSVSWPDGEPALTGPADTSATAITDIVLTWDPVPGAASYVLQKNTTPSFLPVVKGQAIPADGQSVVGTQFSPAITWPNDNYFWRVSAVDSLGRIGPQSQVRTFVRDAADPDRPTLLTPADGAASGEWRFTWSSVPNAGSYELQYSGDSGFTTVSWCTTFHTSLSGYYAAGSTTYPVAVSPGSAACTPPASGDWYWRVRAVDAQPEGNGDGQVGPWSATRLIKYTQTPLSGAVPAQLDVADYLAPASCEAPACTDTVADTPELRWNAVASATFYKVWLANDRKFTSGVRSYVTRGTSLRLRDSLADNSTDKSYYWFVQPCGGGSQTAPTMCASDDQLLKESNAQAFRKLAPQATLSAPVNGATLTDVVAFTWDNLWEPGVDASGAAGYRIQVSTSPSFSSFYDVARVDQTSYMSTTKIYAPGTYYWRVQGLDGAHGQQATNVLVGMPWSDVRSFVVQGTAPSGLLATLPDPAASVPFLTWDASSYLRGYAVQIYRGTSANFDGGTVVSVVASPGVKLSSYSPTINLPAGSYSWRVARIDASGNPGPFVPAAGSGDVPSFEVAAPAPTLISPDDASTLAGRGLLYRWSPVPGAAQYSVEVTGPTAETKTAVSPAYAPTAAYKDGSYSWKVRAKDAAGNTLSVSAARTFTRDSTGPVATIDVSKGSASLTPSGTVSFGEDATGVSASTVTLKRATGGATVTSVLTCADGSGGAVPCSGTDVRRVAVQPAASVVPGETYSVSVTSGIRDAHGNAAAATSASFRALLTVQDSAASPKYTSGWSSVASAAASGGTVKRTATKGSSMSWTFVGTSAKLGYLAQKGAGKAAVYIDGALKATVDMYSKTTTKKSTSITVAKGQHTVKVVMLGTRNAAATSSAINVDYLATT